MPYSSAVHLSMYILRRDSNVVQITIDFTSVWKTRTFFFHRLIFSNVIVNSTSYISTQNFQATWVCSQFLNGGSWVRRMDVDDDKNSSRKEWKREGKKSHIMLEFAICLHSYFKRTGFAASLFWIMFSTDVRCTIVFNFSLPSETRAEKVNSKKW